MSFTDIKLGTKETWGKKEKKTDPFNWFRKPPYSQGQSNDRQNLRNLVGNPKSSRLLLQKKTKYQHWSVGTPPPKSLNHSPVKCLVDFFSCQLLQRQWLRLQTTPVQQDKSSLLQRCKTSYLYTSETSEFPQTVEITGYRGPFKPEKAGPK